MLTTPPGAALACAHGSAVKPVKGVVRALTVSIKGVYRTVGAASTGTSRRATWTTHDRCDGTLTRVRRGRVVVAARTHHRAVTVRARHAYLARARLFAARRRPKA